MTKKEKFDVAVAAFEALLGKNELWKAYLLNFNQCNQWYKSDEFYTSWKKWALHTRPFQWVASAFWWHETPQQHCVWRDLDYQWLQWICRNLNK